MFLYDVREDVPALSASASPVPSKVLGGLPSGLSGDGCERCFGRFQGLKISTTTRNPSRVEIDRNTPENTGSKTIATLPNSERCAVSASFQLPPLPYMSSLYLPSFSSLPHSVSSSLDAASPIPLPFYVSVPVQTTTADTVAQPTNYTTTSRLPFEGSSSNSTYAHWTRQEVFRSFPSANCTSSRAPKPRCPIEWQASVKFWKFSAGFKNLKPSVKATVNPITLLKKCRYSTSRVKSSEPWRSRSTDTPSTALSDSLGTMTFAAEPKDYEDLDSWIDLSNANLGTAAVTQLNEVRDSSEKAETSVTTRSGSVYTRSEERGAPPGRLSLLLQSQSESQDCNCSGFLESLAPDACGSPSVRIFTLGRGFVCVDANEGGEGTMPGGWFFDP